MEEEYKFDFKLLSEINLNEIQQMKREYITFSVMVLDY